MRLRAFLSAAVLVSSAACSGSVSAPPIPSTTPAPVGIGGIVEAGGRPVSMAAVTLFATGGNGAAAGAPIVGQTKSNSGGYFFIPMGPQIKPGALYLTAVGGNNGKGANRAIGLSALAGTLGSAIPYVTINERSTVAMAYALAQFTDPTGRFITTTASNQGGLRNAALLVRDNLIAPATGGAGAVWPSASSCATSRAPANCEGLETLNSLANLLASCTSSAGPNSSACRTLLGSTGIGGASVSAGTLAAIHAIVMNPGHAAADLYSLASSNATFAPALPSAPSAWTLAIKYVGNGHEFDGPGNMAVDAAGDIWVGNNYVYNKDPFVPTCAGELLSALTALGNDVPGAPFSGGGLAGAGFGTVIDMRGNVWVGNFGFSGKGCTTPPPANSVSAFSIAGRPESPAQGYTQGPIDAPQGMAVDFDDNLWIANFNNNTLTEYRNANPNRSRVFRGGGLSKPFGVAVDAANRLWVTNFTGASVSVFANGKAIAGSPFSGAINRPLGIAIDQKGNAWIANNGGDSVTVLDAAGKPVAGSPFGGGGISLPWGIDVDGNGNAWVANFTGRSPRVTELCGMQGHCPAGVSAGQPISPPSGYASSLLQRQTGIVVDPSGNVWVCNNWKPVPVQTNPGGDGLVEFIGLAGPVKAPSYGPPQHP